MVIMLKQTKKIASTQRRTVCINLHPCDILRAGLFKIIQTTRHFCINLRVKYNLRLSGRSIRSYTPPAVNSIIQLLIVQTPTPNYDFSVPVGTG
jgi:hypothetical protein